MKKQKQHVQKPIYANGQWFVRITNGISPFAELIEEMGFSSQETAYQAYRQIRKELGRGL